jgi:hypothetical protein
VKVRRWRRWRGSRLASATRVAWKGARAPSRDPRRRWRRTTTLAAGGGRGDRRRRGARTPEAVRFASAGGGLSSRAVSGREISCAARS